MFRFSYRLIFDVFLLLGVPGVVMAMDSREAAYLDLTSHWVGYTSLLIFVVAYSLVIAEEYKINN